MNKLSRDLTVKLSRQKGRTLELLGLETRSDEEQAELETLEGPDGIGATELELRAALQAEPEPVETESATVDPEIRERLELRSKARLVDYFRAAVTGRQVTGAAAELQQAAGVDGIPLELWDVPDARGQVETRDVTPAPGTVGVNLDTLRPAVFAPSIADKLGIEMPMVGSGTYATGTITTSTTAGAVAKGDPVPETPGAFTVSTTTPKRVGASLELAVEDIAAVGQSNFEGVLRENVSLALSDELDDQAINGTGTGDNLTGLFARLGDPTAPGAGAASFDAFIGTFAGGVDGLWATRMRDVAIVVGVETYRLSAQEFRGANTFISLADYAAKMTGGWWTNKRMPAPASNVQQAILYRKGRAMNGATGGMRTAVCPHWGYLSIDDIYTGARAGKRRFVVSVLVGDVILVQPAAYAQVAFRVAA